MNTTVHLNFYINDENETEYYVQCKAECLVHKSDRSCNNSDIDYYGSFEVDYVEYFEISTMIGGEIVYTQFDSLSPDFQNVISSLVDTLAREK